MRRVIVTDLTRFSKPDKVCTAMIDTNTGECIRPMPYFSSKVCKDHNIQPGAIFTGNLSFQTNATYPHIEDASYSGLKFQGPASSDEFKDVLIASCANSVSEGFDYEFSVRQKHIPVDADVHCSIVTIKVSSNQIQIHEDQYKSGKIKLTFTDESGHEFYYLPITDRGFYDYAMGHQNDDQLDTVQDFIESQDEIYLRIGLSRAYNPDGVRNGYWLQVNGIYTFPNYQRDVRSY
ncbi:dual OB domain-containing protein [Endozoicomonas ascidiicola]|uniref:dual OB domain-containing protein n=1 Tax=Endozoicomonas ascidiicola TaxID=1698521 RepID=UPI000AE6C03A|nr:hypothetical protein [Endozoicomonas ascidiicola]